MQNLEGSENLSLSEDGEKRKIAEGGMLAAHFVRKVSMGRKVDGRRYGFDGDYVRAINKRVAAGADWGGRLREENLGIDEFDAVSWHEVPTRFYLYSNWLDTQMREVTSNPDDIVLALETAAAAHYGLTQPELHPFAFGNGRTARALVNGILMTCADELRLYKIALPPIPILRDYNEDRDRRYIKALRSVRETGTLNPLMTVLANRWSQNLGELLERIHKELGIPKNPADKRMIETLERRKDRLDEFAGHSESSNKNVQKKMKNGYHQYWVPNYFDPVWMKGGSGN
ncbi:MAG: Fic family protein [Candidatus Curtissbacteria bacterium]|nr:Fic family protein [Candidatus Curtissbacteria bacterium]